MAILALSEKLPKWYFLTPAWNSIFFWPNVFFSSSVKVPLSNFFPKVAQATSKCFSKWINWKNWIISRMPRWIRKVLFVLSLYEFLAMLEGKIRKGPFFRVQSDEITVCPPHVNEVCEWPLKVRKR